MFYYLTDYKKEPTVMHETHPGSIIFYFLLFLSFLLAIKRIQANNSTYLKTERMVEIIVIPALNV